MKTKNFLFTLASVSVLLTHCFGAENTASSIVSAVTLAKDGKCDTSCASHIPSTYSSANQYTTMMTSVSMDEGRITCGVYNSSDMSSIIATFSYTDPDCGHVTAATSEAAQSTGNDASNQLYNFANSKIGTSYGTSEKSGYLTLSKMMTVLMTLDADYIDYGSTTSIGRLTLKPGYTDAIDELESDTQGQASSSIAAQKIYLSRVKNIYGFILDFFVGLNELYNLINTYMLAGGMATMLFMLGGGALLKKLQKQEGQDKNYMQYASVGVLGILLFFAPIPSGSSNSSSNEAMATTTAIQQFIRFAAQLGNDWGEKANAIGAQSYVRYLAKNNGLYTQETLNLVAIEIENNQKKIDTYNSIYASCKNSYLVGTDKNAIYKDFSEAATNSGQTKAVRQNSSGANIPSYSLSICNEAERGLKVLPVQNANLISRQTKFAANTANAADANSLVSQVGNIVSRIGTLNTQTGWLGSSVMPASIVWFQNMGITNDEADYQSAEEAARPEGDAQNKNASGESTADTVKNFAKMIISAVPYFIVPGGQAVYGVSNGFINAAGDTIANSVIAFFPAAILSGGIGFGAIFAFFLAKNLIAFGASVYITVMLMTKVILYIPVLALIVASIVKSIMFFLDLFKLMYVSPFVVLWSISTRNPQKILDFLARCSALIVTPTLIVLSVYLAVFMKTIMEDLFLALIFQQFLFFEATSTGVLMSAFTIMFKEMLLIVGEFAAAYVAVRMIIGGSDMFLKMLGVSESSELSKEITSQVTSKLGGKAELL